MIIVIREAGTGYLRLNRGTGSDVEFWIGGI